MKSVVCDLPRELREIEIHSFADWHLGDPLSDTALIKRRIEYVQNTPHAYAVCLGDLADCATIASKGDTYGAVSSPREQIKELVRLLEPVKDKILGWCEGNHERRVYNTTGIWINEQVAAQLGKLDIYDPESIQLSIRFGELSRRQSEGRKVAYTGYLTHGSGGGGTIGAKANQSAKLGSILTCDFYMSGHVHLPMIFTQGYLDGKTVKTQYFLTAGATLKYGGYGCAFGYKPVTTDNPVLILDGSKKEMSARM